MRVINLCKLNSKDKTLVEDYLKMKDVEIVKVEENGTKIHTRDN